MMATGSDPFYQAMTHECDPSKTAADFERIAMVPAASVGCCH